MIPPSSIFGLPESLRMNSQWSLKQDSEISRNTYTTSSSKVYSNATHETKKNPVDKKNMEIVYFD